MSCQGRTSMEGRRDRMRGGVLVRVLMGLTLAETTWLLYPVLRARILTSEEGSVPAFVERTQMMYVKTTDDLREYILDGAPRAKRDDPDYRAKMEAAALRMPAYRAVVTTQQLEDLVAYLRTTSGMVLP